MADEPDPNLSGDYGSPGSGERAGFEADRPISGSETAGGTGQPASGHRRRTSRLPIVVVAVCGIVAFAGAMLLFLQASGDKDDAERALAATQGELSQAKDRLDTSEQELSSNQAALSRQRIELDAAQQGLADAEVLLDEAAESRQAVIDFLANSFAMGTPFTESESICVAELMLAERSVSELLGAFTGASIAPEGPQSLSLVVDLLSAAEGCGVSLDLDDPSLAPPAQSPAGDAPEVSDAAVTGTPLPRFDPELAADPAVGMAAPTITASGFDDTERTLDFGDGEPAVLLFVAHWCPHCQAEVTALSGWFKENGVPDDVRIVTISTGVDPGAPNYPPSAWLLREEWPVPVLRDSSTTDLAAGYGLSAFPYLVIVDGDGEVVTRLAGERPLSVWEANLDLARSH